MISALSLFTIKGKKYCKIENTNDESLYFQFIKEQDETIEEIENNLDGLKRTTRWNFKNEQNQLKIDLSKIW
ncbi:MAG: hypothetical protein K2I49_03385 [Ureaplasma sp.]|nr:hypothetical protein [Ureaplasma sp.]